MEGTKERDMVATETGTVVLDVLSLKKEIDGLRELLRDAVLQVKALRGEVALTAKPTLNRKEAAEFLGVSVNTLNQYCSKKAIPYHWSRQGGMTYFEKEDLLEFMHDTEVREEEIGRQDIVDGIRLKRLRRTEPKSMAV